MKALIGVDRDRHFVSALKLLARMQFPDCHLQLVHAATPLNEVIAAELSSAPLDGPGSHDLVSLLDSQTIKAGAEALDFGLAQASEAGFHAQENLLRGSAADQLMRFGDAHAVDLICASAHRCGPLASFILGSVCRALTIAAKQSVLVVKGEQNSTGPLRVVVATDHSRYAKEGIRNLLRLRPGGLGHVTVLSVIESDYFEAFSGEAAGLAIEQEQAYEVEIDCRTRSLRRQFEACGATADAIVARGEPNAIIAEVMREKAADLLVLGAQGHGFIERLAVGSVALHQVVSENYSVLVMRSEP